MPNQTKGPRFVRFTYQECIAVGPTGGGYEPVGMEQDIRLANGWFTIGEHRTGLQYNIREGRLHRVDGSPFEPEVFNEV